MATPICVYGLWHLGCVTAACLAADGFDVTGLDPDEQLVSRLRQGEPPISEPGLTELLREQMEAGRLGFAIQPDEALRDARTLIVAFDTPVNEDDEADIAWLDEQLRKVRSLVRTDTLVLITSQVPVGFSRRLEREWRASDPTITVAYSPENLRLGQAIQAFRSPERVVVGLGQNTDRTRITDIYKGVTDHLLWMSLESAEMTKHAINAFLAMSVVYANEIGRVCERIGADAREVEQGLRTEPRIGQRAYVSAGPAIAGGTLARDVAFLSRLAREHRVEVPVFDAIRTSNRLHREWTQNHLSRLLRGIEQPRVAILGLTYKPGTDTLRRSSAVELGQWLRTQGVAVTAFDPAIKHTRPEIAGLQLGSSVTEAIQGADVAVIATPWPELREIQGDSLVTLMRRPVVIDQSAFASALEADARIQYIRVGRPLGNEA